MIERRITFSGVFERRLKNLRKRHRHVDEDVRKFAAVLKSGATPGDQLQDTEDYIVYKARIASSDMQRGKSGGFRAIYYLQTDTHIMMLVIYSKTEQDNLSSKEVVRLIKEALDELEEGNAADDDAPASNPDTPPEA